MENYGKGTEGKVEQTLELISYKNFRIDYLLYSGINPSDWMLKVR